MRLHPLRRVSVPGRDHRPCRVPSLYRDFLAALGSTEIDGSLVTDGSTFEKTLNGGALPVGQHLSML